MLDLDSEACSFDALRLDLPPMEYLRLGGILQLATRETWGFLRDWRRTWGASSGHPSCFAWTGWTCYCTRRGRLRTEGGVKVSIDWRYWFLGGLFLDGSKQPTVSLMCCWEGSDKYMHCCIMGRMVETHKAWSSPCSSFCLESQTWSPYLCVCEYIHNDSEQTSIDHSLPFMSVNCTCSNLRISFVHMVCITFVWACGRGY